MKRLWHVTADVVVHSPDACYTDPRSQISWHKRCCCLLGYWSEKSSLDEDKSSLDTFESESGLCFWGESAPKNPWVWEQSFSALMFNTVAPSMILMAIFYFGGDSPLPCLVLSPSSSYIFLSAALRLILHTFTSFCLYLVNSPTLCLYNVVLFVQQ